MQSKTVIVIGGGPAGSSCAWKLREYGIDCLILDKASFPRAKLCAGWITPEVVVDLQMDPEAYPYSFLTFSHLQFHFPMFDYKLQAIQHSIRRFEFDHWLLQRSGCDIIQHDVRQLEYKNGYYYIDGKYKAKYLIGAGGTRCPVYRELFKTINPRARDLQAVTLEEEFAYDYQDPDCHLWFFNNKLPGYAWYVPKQNGYINIGIGAMKNRLHDREQDIQSQWQYFLTQLQQQNLITHNNKKPKGYSYFVRGAVERCQRDNAYIIGDAAGLATRDMCEGIGPAIHSGLMAADSIASQAPFDLQSVAAYSGDSTLVRKLMEFKMHSLLPWQSAF